MAIGFLPTQVPSTDRNARYAAKLVTRTGTRALRGPSAVPKRPATASQGKKAEAYRSLSQPFATYSSVVRSVRLRPAVVLTAVGICLLFLTPSTAQARSRPTSLQALLRELRRSISARATSTPRSPSSATGSCSTGRLASRTTWKSQTPAIRLGWTRLRLCWATSALAVALIPHLKVDRYCRCSRSTRTASRVLVDQSAVVRIAHVVAHSPGYTLGPVVMTFPAFAWGDSAPTWIYGGGDLWLYESDNPGGVDLMRISATTGDVLQRLRVPKVWKPVLAYNDEGLWIAPSGQTSSPEALYLVAPGGHSSDAGLPFPRRRVREVDRRVRRRPLAERPTATRERRWRGVDAARSRGKAGLARSREREPRPGLRDARRFWHGRRRS